MKNKPVLLVGLVILAVVIVWKGLSYRGAQAPTYKPPSVVTPSSTRGAASPTVVPTVSSKNEISLVVSSPVNGATVTSAAVSVVGKTAPRAEVFVNDMETKADASGNFSVRLTLDEGENPIVVLVNDAEGNTAERDLTVTYTPNQ